MLCRTLKKLEWKRRALVFVSDGHIFQKPSQLQFQEL